MSDSRVVLNQLVIDMAVRRVSYRDKLIPLTKLEFDLLAYLVQHKERICTYQELLSEVWGYEDQFDHYLVQLAVCRLRKKFSDTEDVDETSCIRTIRGIGLHFDQSVLEG